MRYLSLLVFALMATGFCQCGSEKLDNIISEGDFSGPIALHGTLVNTKPLFSIEDFFIKDSLLFVRNNREDSIFMVLETRNFGCVNAFGNKGSGPGEYSFPEMVKSTENLFLTYDSQSRKIRAIDQAFHTREIKSSTLGSLPQSIISINDSVLLFDIFDRTSRKLLKWDIQGEPDTIYHFPDLQKQYKDPSVLWGFMGVQPEMERMVYAYQFFRRFDIMDLEGNIIKKVEFNSGIAPVLGEDGRIDYNKSKTVYFGLRTTPSNFYLYYVGYTGDEAKESLQRETFIEQYDWEGRPQTRYRLNQFIWNFEVDEINRRFIGLDNGRESPFLIFEGRDGEVLSF